MTSIKGSDSTNSPRTGSGAASPLLEKLALSFPTSKSNLGGEGASSSVLKEKGGGEERGSFLFDSRATDRQTIVVYGHHEGGRAFAITGLGTSGGEGGDGKRVSQGSGDVHFA